MHLMGILDFNPDADLDPWLDGDGQEEGQAGQVQWGIESYQMVEHTAIGASVF